MADYKINSSYTTDGGIGMIHISDEVVAVIAGIAATELPEVASLVGNITNAIVSRIGFKSLSQGVKLSTDNSNVYITITANLYFGSNIPATAKKIQDRVASAVENMTGQNVAEVSVVINDLVMDKK